MQRYYCIINFNWVILTNYNLFLLFMYVFSLISYIVPVRNLTIMPSATEKMTSGEKVNCSAVGNPAPRIDFEHTPPQPGNSALDKSSSPSFNFKEIVLKPLWEKTKVTLYCSATNTFNGRTETISSNITIYVTGNITHIIAYVSTHVTGYWLNVTNNCSLSIAFQCL